MNPKNHIIQFKVVVLGDTNTGKTSIIRRFTHNEFLDEHNVTTLPITQSKRFLNEKKPFELSIWDTAGSEEWVSMNSSIMHGAKAVIFVSSIENEDSFDNIFKIWYNRINEHTNPHEYISFIVINKNDLSEDQKILQQSRVEEKSKEINAKIFFVSAKNGDGITELFETIAQILCSHFSSIFDLQSKDINCNCECYIN